MRKAIKKSVVFLLVLLFLSSGLVFGITACNDEHAPLKNPCGYVVCICEENTPIPNPIPNPCKQDPCICEKNAPYPKSGRLYSLSAAHEKGLLTISDIKHISYFRAGLVIEIIDRYTVHQSGQLLWKHEANTLINSGQTTSGWLAIKPIDFAPSFARQSLARATELAIQKTAYKAFVACEYRDPNQEFILLIDDFYGEYNGVYVFSGSDVSGLRVISFKEYAGFVFMLSSTTNFIQVFVYN